MQLHSRKRCYTATQENSPQSHPFHPSVMGQNLFGATVKQEPMSFSSCCPLSSPIRLKCTTGNCPEDRGRCKSQTPVSTFLTPQCSPRDSPNEKPCTSPQPSTPSHNSYLTPPTVGKDGCGQHQGPGHSGGHNMEVGKNKTKQRPGPDHVQLSRALYGL